MTSRAVAFITGASQGIGRAIALRLSDDGFDIAINDVHTSKEKFDVVGQEILAKGRRVCALLGDVSVEQEVVDMIATIIERLGRLDVASATFVTFIKFHVSFSCIDGRECGHLYH
jgi:NAD(P)-dependent dehydrogenase (short-subunit alcohol dehydrogenase family)